jgi:zinc D-Ala-D-Ala carboxypeptidase
MTPHFTKEEVACRCGCGLVPSMWFMQKVEKLRLRYGKPLVVSSGARCPSYNRTVSKTGSNGPHTKDAIDFQISGTDAYMLLRHALELGFTGIGINQKGPHNKRFIHLDNLPNEQGQPRAWVWSY